MPYDYHATLGKIIGPLTMWLDIDTGFRNSRYELVRLDGLQMPPRDKRSEVMAFVTAWFNKHPQFIVHSFRASQQSNLDRWLARIWCDEDDAALNDELAGLGLCERQQSGLYPSDELDDVRA